ncbi:diacylglycerol lipase-alpha-like [Paramacrobiotus metropolitanus]|uniref:diacylglycerol lipase-alpha-like n=1 Tax=Paramacrobiotus metropolitanus TaxID=2943436 RepID=UPI0024461B55|nr:diacylglycerol lipase-alpha-like [Paramacrobiotus metropolitanus]XP_055335540.1 diacylglycerol lipase-alpha-like [Paramacrobiotus metropolitanus]XP_055335541.1 diacylglycerol lipase-alpha-like [Paramacrobiotus metropolitanus]
MPGLVLFRRRWAIAYDDLVFPSLFLLISHIIWTAMEILLYILVYQLDGYCNQLLQIYALGSIVITSLAAVLEICIGCVTKRGSIMNTNIRKPVRAFLYFRCALFFLECGWTVFGIVWLAKCYPTSLDLFPKSTSLGLVIFNGIFILIVIVGVYLSYDYGGSKWLKLRKYEANIQITGSKLHHGSGTPRTWRTRKTVRAYQTSWDRRCRLLFCCLGTGQRTSLGEIAQLLSDFFRDLDLVPSDIVAGVILLRKYQKLRRSALLTKNRTYKFLSGAPITKDTKFLDLQDPVVSKEYKQLVRYMRFSLAVYGWPMYLFRGNTCRKLVGVLPGLRCVCCFWLPARLPGIEVLDDNCCNCNSSAMWAVMKSVAEDESIQFIHASYTGGVGITPYFLALDHLEKKIVVTIRGTLSMKDIVTDLNADAEFIPVDPLQTNPPWLAHKGMVAAAEYVKKKLIQEGKLKQLLLLSKERTGSEYDLLLVGHSLGGGTAAILAIMLKPEFPTLKCICFSPPGGLLNLPAAEYSKPFVTTCLLGKDMVARLGLHQLEAMRSDLLNVIQRSTCPKWKILLSSICGRLCPTAQVDPALKKFAEEQIANSQRKNKPVSPYMTTHPPMYLPGKIIQIVRRYPNEKSVSKTRSVCCLKSQRKGDPIYQAIEADRDSFYEISLSPSMVDDHMPDTLLAAMEKVLEVVVIPNTNGLQNDPGIDLSDATSGSGTSDATDEGLPVRRSNIPYTRDLTLPFADATSSNFLSTPGSLTPFSEGFANRPASRCSSVSRQTLPISQLEETASSHPRIQIYSSLVDQGTSCYTLGSPGSETSCLETTQAEIHLDTFNANRHLAPDSFDSPKYSTTRSRVSKAKSLNEMCESSPKKSRHRKVSGEPSHRTAGRPNATRNNNADQQNRAQRAKSVSQETLLVASNKKPHGVQVHVQGVENYDFQSSSPSPVLTVNQTGTVANFTVLPDKTQYGTIYYV